jgi:hypothetical protein
MKMGRHEKRKMEGAIWKGRRTTRKAEGIGWSIAFLFRGHWRRRT